MIMLAQTLVPQEMKFRKKFWWSKLDDQKFRLFILKCVWKFHIQCYTFFANVRLNACSNKNANTYRLILWKLDSKIYSLFLMPYFIYQNYRISLFYMNQVMKCFLKWKYYLVKNCPTLINVHAVLLILHVAVILGRLTAVVQTSPIVLDDTFICVGNICCQV